MKVCSIMFAENRNGHSIGLCIVKEDEDHIQLNVEDLDIYDPLRFLLEGMQGRLSELRMQLESGIFDKSISRVQPH